MPIDKDEKASDKKEYDVMIPSEQGRVLLRPWKESDQIVLAAIFADPKIAAMLAHEPDPKRGLVVYQSIHKQWEKQGWGIWAMELLDIAECIGYVGFSPCKANLPFAPAIEIEWCLATPYWGKGLVTEAALVALKHGFQTLGFSEIVSYTALTNHRSRHVMERIGMRYEEGKDFPHPDLPRDHPLSTHVLYRLPRMIWVEEHARRD